MATEPSATYPGSWEAATDKIKWEIWNRVWVWAKDHIGIAILLGVLLGVLLILLIKVIVPALPDLFQKWVESRQNKKTERDYTVRNQDRLISNLPAPAVDSRYAKKALPEKVDDLAKTIESTSDGTRYRYCVVCPDQDLAKHYAALFFGRMDQAATVDKLGWVNYQRPRDKMLELCAKHCMVYDLNLFAQIDSVDNRFRAQCTHFKRPDLHSLLVFWMYEDALADDAELRQIAALEGLSVVLFATSQVDGFENLVISEKGGKSK